MNLASILVLAAALVGLAWALQSRFRRRRQAPAVSPTVMAQPMTIRPLNAGERQAYRILIEAMPRGYLLLPQVALARFIKVSERTSYRGWYDRIGHRCVDFLVCNSEGELVVVVELDEQSNQSPQYQQVVRRKAKVLDEACVPVMQWNSADLPSVEQAREALEGAATDGGLRARQRLAQPSANMPLSARRGTRPQPLAAEDDAPAMRWRDPLPDGPVPHVSDTVILEETGIVLSAHEQRMLGRQLSSRPQGARGAGAPGPGPR